MASEDIQTDSYTYDYFYEEEEERLSVGGLIVLCGIIFLIVVPIIKLMEFYEKVFSHTK